MAATAEVPVTLEFSLDLTTDPLGADLTVAVPDAPSDEARQALLDGIERSLVGAQGNLVFQAIQQAHDNLDQYASAHGGYDVAPLKDSLTAPAADRDQTSIHVAWSWQAKFASLAEFGASPYTIEGDPLVFNFDAGEYPGLADAFPGGTAFLQSVEHPGFPEGRWVRDSLNWLRSEVGQ